MAETSTSKARRIWRRQFGQLYLAALIVTLVPHTVAWTLPTYLAHRDAKHAVVEATAAQDALVHGRLDDALATAERALALSPELDRAQAIQASAFIERFWVAKTESDLRAARALVAGLQQSRSSAALVARGNLALVDRDPKRAVSLMSDAVELDSTDAYAQHQYGFALNEAGRRDDALARFKQALMLAPKMAWVQANLASLLSTLQRCDETIPGLIAEARASCFDSIGVKQYNSGRFEEGRRSFERAVQLAPETGGYHANYAIALLQTGDRAGAAEHATRAKALGVKDHPVFAPLGIR
jgi:tetratricopeptide (TPR) repeat protein